MFLYEYRSVVTTRTHYPRSHRAVDLGSRLPLRRTRTAIGERAFSVAGKQQWNALPSDIRNTTERVAIKRTLKERIVLNSQSI